MRRHLLTGGVLAAALVMLTLPHDLAAQRQPVRIATGPPDRNRR
jgi:hypothetical protein